jgi:hypothetical protein
MKNIPRHPKLRGEWVEVRFLARATELGLRVAKPYGDCLPYDFIIEHAGRMYRVQVKSTSHQAGGYEGYKCFVKCPSGKLYPPDALDFIAAYVVPEDVWYIIPFRDLSTSTISLDPRNPRNRYRPYREAWDLLLTSLPNDVQQKEERQGAAAKSKPGTPPQERHCTKAGKRTCRPSRPRLGGPA